MLHTSDFDFELPAELIASHPLARRDASRMLVVGGDDVGSPPLEGCPQGGVVRDVVNYRTLPYNQQLKDRARQLRKAGSLPEALLWREIKNKKLNGLDFDRQKVIGNYIVDFFCASKFLVIEIDDKATHDNKCEYDATRDEYLKSLNLTVIHIPAADVLKNPYSVYEYLSNHPGLRPPLQRRGTGPASSDGVEYVSLSDKHIRDFLDYLRPGDVVVFNNSRVIPARFNAAIDGHIYEITLHTATNDGAWWGLCKKFNKIPVGGTLTLDDGTTVCVIDRDDDSGLKLKFNTDDLFGVLDRVGKMPLPPYMKRDTETADRERYQTVYADPIGSMAAPTAGLHFTPELMSEIERRGAKIVKVTLHVGAGTWMPVKTEDLSQHKMHGEWCQITPAQADIINAATRVIAVGTTSMRTLESAAIRARKCDENQFPSGEGNGRRLPNKFPSYGGVAAGRGGLINKASVNFNLPYNKSLVDRAHQLRKAGSLSEALLWREIKGKQINGFDFDRQKVIGNYIVDFFCPATGLVIEIDDNATHNNKFEYEATRDEYLKSLGLDVLHIPAADVLKNPASVAEYLKTAPALRVIPPQEGNFACGRRRVVPFCDVTDIFITPGYKFGAVDVLLTNFHLPKSTLFMLVSAFAGLDEMKAAYKHAVAKKYRFFSYGDCCLLFKNDGGDVCH